MSCCKNQKICCENSIKVKHLNEMVLLSTPKAQTGLTDGKEVSVLTSSILPILT